MTDTGNNPFAEPDFSSLRTSGDEGEPDYNDERVENAESELEEDDLEELDAASAAAGTEWAEDDAGNRVAGGTARSVLEHVARSIVDDPEAVEIDVAETRSGVMLSLHVAPSDMGRIIGRRGRTAQALRTVVRAAATRDGQEASIDIVD